MESPRRGGRSRRLRLEPLEDRRLLAVASFAFELYADQQGAAGEPLDEAAPLEVGQRVHVAATAQEFLPSQAGLTGVSLDLQWDPQVFQLVGNPSAEDLITDDLPLLQGGTIDAQKGAIEDLHGLAAPGFGAGRAIGNLAPEPVAWLTLEVLQESDGSQLRLARGASGITTAATANFADGQLEFETQTITVVGPAGHAADGSDDGDGSPLADEADGQTPAEQTQPPTGEAENDAANAEVAQGEDGSGQTEAEAVSAAEGPAAAENSGAIAGSGAAEGPEAGGDSAVLGAAAAEGAVSDQTIDQTIGQTVGLEAGHADSDMPRVCIVLVDPAELPDTAPVGGTAADGSPQAPTIGPAPAAAHAAADAAATEVFDEAVDEIMQVFDSIHELLSPTHTEHFRFLIEMLAAQWLQQLEDSEWDS